MTLAATGSARLAFWADIHGCPQVFGDTDLEPADSWFASRTNSTLKPYLAHEGITLDETVDFVDGTCNVQGLELRLLDVDQELTAILKSGLGTTRTRLTASLTASATTVTVDSTAAFPAAGVIYVHQEAIYYIGKTATTFTNCVRGYYNTEARAHEVDYDAVPPRVPVVRDGFWPLAGRRVDIYKGELDASGALETISGAETECIFRGFIGSQAETGGGEVTLSVDSIFARWDESIGDRMYSGPILPGYYFKGLLGGVTGADDHSLSTIQICIDDGATVETEYVSISGAFYDFDWLVRALQAAVNSALLATYDIDVAIDRSEEKVKLRWNHGGTGGPYGVEWRVQPGDPLWALGFEAGTWGTELPDGGESEWWKAKDEPKVFVMELCYALGDATQPYCQVPDESQYTAGTWVAFGGDGNQTCKIASVATAGQVKFAPDPRVGDPLNFDWKGYIAIDDEADLVLSQVFAMYGDTLKEGMQRCLGLLSGQPEPAAWCLRGIESGDVDWTELDDALVGAPLPLDRIYDAVSEPIKFQEYFCDRLGVLGIAPRLTDEGKIGFVRITDPIELNAHELELDSDIWEYFGAAHIRAALEGQQYLTRVELCHSKNWTGAKDPKPCSIDYDNGTNTLGRPFTCSYQLRGVHVASRYGLTAFASTTELVNALADILLGTHFTYYAGDAPVVPIPCIHRAKTYRCGDIVQITHELLPDVAEGARGVTDRLGLVVHRTQQWTDQAADVVYVMLPATVLARPIAPCALADGWDQGTKTLSFSNTGLYAQSGETDLDYFEAGMLIGYTQYNATSPSTGTATVSAVDTGAKTVVLTTDPFGASLPSGGVWIHYPSWDSCSAYQQKWLAVGDTSYGLGSTPDEAHMWGV